jgi:hypothetical protein
VALTVWPLIAEAQELRDPFTFGTRHRVLAPRPKTTQQLVLVGIIWDPAQPLALIGEQTVAVGQTIDGWRIEAITPEHVVLQREDERVTLLAGAALPE